MEQAKDPRPSTRLATQAILPPPLEQGVLFLKLLALVYYSCSFFCAYMVGKGKFAKATRATHKGKATVVGATASHQSNLVAKGSP